MCEAEADAGAVVDVSAVHLEAVGEEADTVVVVVTRLDLVLEYGVIGVSLSWLLKGCVARVSRRRRR